MRERTMRTSRLVTALLALGIVPSVAHAQLDMFDDTPMKMPWEYFKLNPKTKVKLDFRNASIDAVLQYLGNASGVGIIKDPTLTGGITLQSPKPQTLNDAFSMLSTALSLRNFSLSKSGNFLVIKAQPKGSAMGGGGGRGSNPFGGGTNPFGGGTGPFGATPQLKTYSLKYANATQVARVINEVFQNSGQNLMQQMMGMMGGAGAPGSAPTTPPATGGNPTGTSSSPESAPQPLGTQIAMAAQGGFGGFGGGQGGGRGNRGGGGGGFNFGGGQGGGFNPFGGGGGFNFGGGGFGRGGFGGGAGSSVVRASADDYSNSVIVNAPTREQEQVGKLIADIDKETDLPQQSKVFKINYANATDLVVVIQNLLISNAPRGRGGQTTTAGQGGFGGFGGGGFGGFGAGGFGRNNAQAQVVAEARTNSLLVTTTKDNLELVEKVLKELDKEVKFESTSFVLTLENARADLIAQLMNQSFGSRSGTGTGTRTGTGLTGNTARTNRTTTGGGAAGGGGAASLGGRGVPVPGNEQTVDGTAGDAMMLNLANQGAGQGDLATMVTVQQGGGFGGFGGGFGQGGFGQGGQGTNRNSTSGTRGLDSQGRVVNLRDLTGQVTVIPDINTNSVIVVTAPENRELLERILNQLDKIPEQVMIETLIVEASLDATSKLGVEWNFSQGTVLGQKNARGSGSQGFGNQANTAQPQGLRYTLTGGQYSAFLNTLQSDSRFEVLSTPRIFTSNNSPAEINISQSLPYVLSQRTDANGNLTFNYAFLDVGIILTVTPRITSNGYVTMDVTQTANDFVRYTDFNAPVVNQREAQTTVSVKDGETIVLGGIIKNSVSTTVNKLPVVGDIPVLGKLFQSSGTTKSKTELLVFLTPHVVRDSNDARKLRDATTGQLQPKVQDRVKDVIPLTAIPPKDADKAKVKGEKPKEEGPKKTDL